MKNTIGYFVICILMASCIGQSDFSVKETKKEMYKGVIISKFIDSANHCERTGIFHQLNGNHRIVFDLWPDSWGYTKISDSIIKDADTLMITIKKNDSIKKKFNYRFSSN